MNWSKVLAENKKKLAISIANAFKFLESEHRQGNIHKDYTPTFIKNGERKKKKSSNKNRSSLNRNKYSRQQPKIISKYRGIGASTLYSDKESSSSSSESSSSSDSNPDINMSLSDSSESPNTKRIDMSYKPHYKDNHDAFGEGFVEFYEAWSMWFGELLRENGLLNEAARRPKGIWWVLSHFEVFQVPAQVMGNKLVPQITNAMNERGLGRITNVIVPVRNRMSADSLNNHDKIHHDTLNQFCQTKLDRKNVELVTFCYKVICTLSSKKLQAAEEMCLQAIRDQRIQLGI